MTEITNRIQSLRDRSATRTREQRNTELAQRREQWAAIQNADPALAELMTTLRHVGMDFKPIYVLVKHDNPTTQPGTYRFMAGGLPHTVTVKPGFQRVM